MTASIIVEYPRNKHISDLEVLILATPHDARRSTEQIEEK